MGEIKKIRYMTEITIYPNNSTFVKSWMIGEQKSINNEFIKQKKAIAKTKEEQTKQKEEQKYQAAETIEM